VYVLYQRPPIRRPVRTSPLLGFWDVQGALPRSWCCGCGSEVFYPGTLLCHRCEKEEKENVDKRISMYKLHPGT